MNRAPGWLSAQPAAHRGLHDAGAGVPENSLTAFDRAVAAGYPVEIDVQLAADGVPVVFHDHLLDRLTNATGVLEERPSAELQRIRLRGAADPIPTLAEVLRLIDGRVPVIVEIKSVTAAVGPREAATLAVLRGYAGACTVQSFRPETLGWLRRQAPHVVRGQLACNFERPGRAAVLTPARRAMLRRLMFDYLSQPDYVSYNIADLPFAPVARARRRGLPVIGYTAHSQAEFDRAAPYIDGIIFEGFRPPVTGLP